MVCDIQRPKQIIRVSQKLEDFEHARVYSICYFGHDWPSSLLRFLDVSLKMIFCPFPGLLFLENGWSYLDGILKKFKSLSFQVLSGSVWWASPAAGGEALQKDAVRPEDMVLGSGFMVQSLNFCTVENCFSLNLGLELRTDSPHSGFIHSSLPLGGWSPQDSGIKFVWGSGFFGFSIVQGRGCFWIKLLRVCECWCFYWKPVFRTRREGGTKTSNNSNGYNRTYSTGESKTVRLVTFALVFAVSRLGSIPKSDAIQVNLNGASKWWKQVKHSIC